MKNIKLGSVVYATIPNIENSSVQCGERPVIILGNQKAIRFSPLLSCCPLTARLSKLNKIPTHVLIEGEGILPSVALPESIVTLPKENFSKDVIYNLTDRQLENLNSAIQLQFGF